MCDEVISRTDRVAAARLHVEGQLRSMHVECSLRSVLGGWGHFIDHEYWCTEKHDPDGGLSYRESARKVFDAYIGGEIGTEPDDPAPQG